MIRPHAEGKNRNSRLPFLELWPFETVTNTIQVGHAYHGHLHYWWVGEVSFNRVGDFVYCIAIQHDLVNKGHLIR